MLLNIKKQYRKTVFAAQADGDGDGTGDVCVGDADGDSVIDYQVFTTVQHINYNIRKN